MTEFFASVPEPIGFGGPGSDDPLVFRWYEPDRVVGGRSMADQLRFAVAYWHSFAWDGFDIFGAGTLDRPWVGAGVSDPLGAAGVKMGAAFEFFEKLGVPFFCFHDVDIAPAGASFGE
ncbi:MAG: xylose isomerase, partial [Actinomycetota bacterium]